MDVNSRPAIYHLLRTLSHCLLSIYLSLIQSFFHSHSIFFLSLIQSFFHSLIQSVFLSKQDWELKSVVLQTAHFPGNHTAALIAEKIKKIILQDWQISQV